MGKLSASTSSKGVAAGASTTKVPSFKKHAVAKATIPPQKSSASAAATASKQSANMDDIFGALNKKKSLPSGSVGSSKDVKPEPLQNSTQPKKGDGLYRATATSVEMGDDDFFGESVASASASRKTGKKKTSASAKPQRSLEKEGVDRVITEDELLKLTSGKEEAGTTPNCPFDCDCCY